jgi:hypothetical protein
MLDRAMERQAIAQAELAAADQELFYRQSRRPAGRHRAKEAEDSGKKYPPADVDAAETAAELHPIRRRLLPGLFEPLDRQHSGSQIQADRFDPGQPVRA